MADIFVTVRAREHPTSNDVLIVDVIPEAPPQPGDDPSTVYLSIEDSDRIVWTGDLGSIAGSALVSLASDNNPFDPTASTGGDYLLQRNGFQNSGQAVVIPPDDEASFLEFKYSVLVGSDDNQRRGSIDPHIRIRRRRVYVAA